MGIFSTFPMWRYLFNGAENCPEVSSSPLLWVPDGSAMDGKQNFDSYNATYKFGGWQIPYMKRYQHFYMCVGTMEMCYY